MLLKLIPIIHGREEVEKVLHETPRILRAPIRQTASEALMVRQNTPRLLHQTRLADPGFADDGNQAIGAIERALKFVVRCTANVGGVVVRQSARGSEGVIPFEQAGRRGAFGFVVYFDLRYGTTAGFEERRIRLIAIRREPIDVKELRQRALDGGVVEPQGKE